MKRGVSLLPTLEGGQGQQKIFTKPRATDEKSPHVILFPHVNRFLIFRSQALHNEFLDYSEANRSEGSALAVLVFMAFALIPYIVWECIAYSLRSSQQHETNDFSTLVVTVVMSLVVLILSGIVYLLHLSKYRSEESFWERHHHQLQRVQTALIVVVTTLVCFRLIRRVLNGQCMNSNSIYELWNCNPVHVDHDLPGDSVLIVMIVPSFLGTLLRGTPIIPVIICWLTGIACLVACTVLQQSESMVLQLVLYVVASVIFCFEARRRDVQAFLLYRQLKQTLSRNEAHADEVHATEMRHMIANVAHDLKTPLSSFLSGTEFISQVVNEMNAKLSQHTFSIHEMQECVVSISNCLKNIRNTNSFMLMTINRCIDYTKASKGLKLVPKPETIDLLDSLMLPMSCMNDVQSRVTIKLLNIPKDICTHVITDKQWLQENILCLLSNAAKYSSGGEVTITISLHRHDPNSHKGHTGESNGDNVIVTRVKSLFFQAKILPEEKTGDPHNNLSGNSDDKSISIGSHVHNNMASGDKSSNGLNSDTLTANQLQSQQSKIRGTGSTPTVRSYAYHLHNNLLNEENEDSNSRRSTITNYAPPIIISGAVLPPNDHLPPASSVVAVTASASPQVNSNNDNNSKTTSASPTATIAGLQFLRFEVEDNGIGISEETMEALFSPFKQAQRLAGGTGLGLYSLFKRVEALSGACGVQARRDGLQGSLFWFEIPYRPDKYYAKIQRRRQSYFQQHEPPSAQTTSHLTGGVLESDAVSVSPVPTDGGDDITSQPGNTNTIGNRAALLVDCRRGSMDIDINGLEISPINSEKMDEKDDDHQDHNNESSTNNVINANNVISPRPPLAHQQQDRTAASSSTNIPSSEPSATGANLLIPRLATNISPPDSNNSGSAGVSPHDPVGHGYHNAAQPQQVHEKLNILIVDDSPSIVKMTTMMLKRHGHNVTSAQDGAEGLKKITEQIDVHNSIFDVILMDLQMPVMDGLEATRRLRHLELTGYLGSSKKASEGSTPPKPVLHVYGMPFNDNGSVCSDATKLRSYKHIVIGVSANSDNETAQAAFKVGIDAFIGKPFSVATFYETYDEIKHRRDREAETRALNPTIHSNLGPAQSLDNDD